MKRVSTLSPWKPGSFHDGPDLLRPWRGIEIANRHSWVVAVFRKPLRQGPILGTLIQERKQPEGAGGETHDGEKASG